MNTHMCVDTRYRCTECAGTARGVASHVETNDVRMHSRLVTETWLGFEDTRLDNSDDAIH